MSASFIDPRTGTVRTIDEGEPQGNRPFFGDDATRRAWEAACNDARIYQLVRYAVAPSCAVLLRDGRRLEAGAEITTDDCRGYRHLHDLVRQGVVIEVSPAVLACRRRREDATHRLTGAVTSPRGILVGFVAAADFDRPGQSGAEVLARLERAGRAVPIDAAADGEGDR